MPTYAMGEVIRTLRIRNGITQEELAFGICSTSMLSKFENGKAMPKQTFEAIQQRLVGELMTGIALHGQEELEKAWLKKQIMTALYRKDRAEAELGLGRYRQIREKKNPFDNQFCIMARAVLAAEQQRNYERIMKYISFALGITMPEKNMHDAVRKRNLLISYEEIFCLNGIAVLRIKTGDYSGGLRELFYLKGYLEEKKEWYETNWPIHSMVLYNVAFACYGNGRWDDALRLCDDGIRECCRLGRLTVLPYLFCLKAKCLLVSKHRVEAGILLEQTQKILELESCGVEQIPLWRFCRKLDFIFVVR